MRIHLKRNTNKNLLGKKRENDKSELNESFTTSSTIDDNIMDEINPLLKQSQLNEKEKKTLYKLIKTIPKDIKEKENEQKKINLVLDLDHTIIFSSQFPEIQNNRYIKDIYYKILFKSKDLETVRLPSNLVYVFHFREGLKSFFDNTKNFCNYYIYSSSYKVYASQVVKKLEEKFGIKIQSIKANDDISFRDTDKNLSKINLNSENSIIIDDNPSTWRNNLNNIILSKRFYDYKIMYFLRQNNIKELDSYILLKQCEKDLNILGFFAADSHILNENNIKNCLPYNVESNNFSERHQLKYIANFIQKIYYLHCYYGINVPNAIKILRINIFYKMKFYIEKDCRNYKALYDMIKFCGGDIEETINNDKNIIYINQEFKEKNNIKSISDEYIYDCYFMMNKFDINDKYYHYRKVIELTDED